MRLISRPPGWFVAGVPDGIAGKDSQFAELLFKRSGGLRERS